MKQEELNQIKTTRDENLENDVDFTDEEEIEDLLEDMLEGYHPVELSSDEYYVWMAGDCGKTILEYTPKKHSIQTMVDRGLIIPGSWQFKKVAGLFHKRFYYLTEKGRCIAHLL